MKDYFLTLLTASVMGGILAVLASGSSYEKYIKYIASLICVVIILSPLKSFVSSPFKLPDVYTESVIPTQSVDGAAQVIASVTVSELDAYIKDILFIRFGINVPVTDIKIDWTDNCLIINEIIVYLVNADREYQTEVKEFLGDTIDKGILVEVLEDPIQ